ncbi:hypothetical protein N2152v2_011092 [Parachlorella kessleri]
MQLALAHFTAAQRNFVSQRRSFTGKQLGGRAASNGCKVRAFFGKIAKGIKEMGGGGAASIDQDELYYTPESRACYKVEDAKDYYTITGIYAVQGNYDLFDTMVATGSDPVDLILLMACSEGDDGKVEECLKSGAHPDTVDHEGRSALDIATKDEIKDLLKAALASRN